MNQLTYYCTCGCSFKADQIKQTHIKGVKMYACTKHKAPVEYRTVVCADCNKQFQISRVGKIPKYCMDCRIERGISVRAEIASREPKAKDAVCLPARNKNKERSDCIHRDACLWESSLKDIPMMLCTDCDQYEPKEPEITVQSNRHDHTDLYTVRI